MVISVKNNCIIKTGLFPELIVTAPAGSTIDLLVSSVVVQTYTLRAAETEHTFYNLTIGTTYTVIATNGSQSNSQTVLIDEVGRFNVSISFLTYLYNAGDECTSLTGGLNFYFLSASSTARSNTQKMSDHLHLESEISDNAYDYRTGALCYNSLSVTGFTKIGVKLKIPQNTGNGWFGIWYGSGRNVTNSGCYGSTYLAGGVVSDSVIKYATNVSNFADKNPLYLGVWIWGQASGTIITADVYQIWLE